MEQKLYTKEELLEKWRILYGDMFPEPEDVYLSPTEPNTLILMLNKPGSWKCRFVFHSPTNYTFFF